MMKIEHELCRTGDGRTDFDPRKIKIGAVPTKRPSLGNGAAATKGMQLMQLFLPLGQMFEQDVVKIAGPKSKFLMSK